MMVSKKSVSVLIAIVALAFVFFLGVFFGNFFVQAPLTSQAPPSPHTDPLIETNSTPPAQTAPTTPQTTPLQNQTILTKNYCTPDSRNRPAGCSNYLQLVCGWTDNNTPTNFSNPCNACDDPTIAYWTTGSCPGLVH